MDASRINQNVGRGVYCANALMELGLLPKPGHAQVELPLKRDLMFIILAVCKSLDFVRQFAKQCM